jgi:hypothetical protein
MTIYKIYDAEDNSVCLRKGTLNECRIALEQWIDDNNDDGWENEIFPENPQLELFLSSPQMFIDTNGDTDIEIYSDWVLAPVYRISESHAIVNKIELASELASMKLEREWRDTEHEMYVYDKLGTTTYTEGAQDLFNEYYDDYLSLIEKCI